MIFELCTARMEDAAQVINDELSNKNRSFAKEVRAELNHIRTETQWLAKFLCEVERRLGNEYTDEDFIRAVAHIKAVRAAP
jgi:hypothetical protein